MFIYGGCGGNHNNFENKTDCETFCADYATQLKANETDVGTEDTSDHVDVAWDQDNCLLAPRHGYCHALEPRWFFSHWDNICKPYNYTGCGANKNSFKSEVMPQSL